MKGSIRERSPGRWAIIIDDPNSSTCKRRWHSFKGTKRQAQLKCAALITDMQNGSYLAPDKTTFAEFAERWLTHVSTQVSPKSHERYSEIMCKNVVPLIGAVVLTKLKPAVISAAYAKALESGRRDGTGGLSPRTVHHMHRLIRQSLAQAVKWELLARNPADAVDPPRVERTAMNTYTLPQTGELIDAMRGTSLFVPTLLAVLLGMRRGEIAALRWKAVDLDTGQLAVVESAEQMNGTVRLKPPNNGRTTEELHAHRAAQAQELLKLGVRLTEDHFVCTHADGRMMQPTWITHEWIALISETGLPRIRFHDLRHAHATHMLAGGIHPKIASERLGHSKVGITLDLYSHVMPGMQENAAAQVDAALQAAMKKPR